ncbi:MAG: integrase catalytic domain-containing protein [Gammaproteobacteria bacterium]
MLVTLNTQSLSSLSEVRAFLDGSAEVTFSAPPEAGRQVWLAATLRQFRYRTLKRADRGLVRAFALKLSGDSRAQLTRLIGQWRRERQIVDRRGPPAKPFTRRYTEADVRRLVELDRLHGPLSGPATKKLAERAFNVFHEAAYERLARISVAHLYHLRASAGYRRRRGHYEPTRAARSVPIGERRRPQPHGQPGYLRVDSVHQGNFDGLKGLYVIHRVDAVTQFEVVLAVERISERFLVPALQQALEAFPFPIQGVHGDNGSEYINYRVAALLEKLRIEFTKSRSLHSNDNALVESKNASVVRKHLGYSYIPARYAQIVDTFLGEFLTPYLNYHRPCFFPEVLLDAKGRQRRCYRYEQLNTPYEKLKALQEAASFLKPGLSFPALDRQACSMTDNQAANPLNQERKKLFQSIQNDQAA